LALPTVVDVWWSPRRSRILLVAAHFTFLLVAPLITAVGFEDPPRNPWLVAIFAIGIAGLQLRHSFGAARGVPPSHWPLTLTILGVLVFAPLPWFGIDWASIQWCFIASAAMLLSGQLRLLFTVGPIIGTTLWSVALDLTTSSGSQIPGAAVTVQGELFNTVYWVVGLSYGAACLYGAARLVRAVDELIDTRQELADSTVGRERLRLSRDLHDLLGQSLSAVSLKGELALALLRSGSRPAAETEIQGITAVAREALRDIRRVVRDERPMSLTTETRGAGALLAAASINPTVAIDVGDLLRPIDDLLGWATREGVTNMLRHSQASNCSIRAARENGTIVLEIVNDGAGPSATSAGGSGISGLRERANALAGSVTAGQLRDGRFRLRVEVPEVIR
jgi:two-component system sensor histidine kinase DesK